MYCHLNHDISLLSKVICVSIFWDVATGCYCNMHFPPSILYCFQVVTFTSSLRPFLPPSSSVSPSGSVPAPLANRRENTRWFLCLVFMKQSTTLPSFQADHLQINLLMYHVLLTCATTHAMKKQTAETVLLWYMYYSTFWTFAGFHLKMAVLIKT